MRFGSVGILCLFVQISILHNLTPAFHPVSANGIGFITSAQLNFLLSYHFTWRDSARKKGFPLAGTWAQFNLVVLGAVIVNSVAFTLFRYVFTDSNVAAAVAATATSTTCTFLINHFYVLRPGGQSRGNTERSSHLLSSVE
ncbi:GtrA family protein [Kocuria kalidii]|uniref:GtrA family protein n=1 Tax=Kocuria kalidii TaxID=3376283 RepID=UPI0037962EA3